MENKSISAGTSIIKKRKFNITQNIILIIVITIIFLVVSLIEPKFISKDNLQNILKQLAVLGILSLGTNLLMISGGLDLSIGSIIGLTCCVITVLVNQNFNLTASIIIGFLVAIACGLLNGVIIAKSGGFPFIITLGTMSIYSGIALVITNGESYSLQGKFQYLGQGKIGFIPIITIVWAAVGIFTYLLLKYSKFGRSLYIIGGNEKAAFFSGIKIDRNKIIIYALNGAIVGLAAMVLVSRLGSAVPTTGAAYTLRVIGAVVIGGTFLFGGKGNVLGVLLGTTLLGIISNALNALDIAYYYQNIMLGIVIIGAAIASTLGELKR